MAIIKLENLKAGMELASDVKDLTGRTLLKASAKISEKHLTIFKSWGVTEVDVQGVKKEDVEDNIGKELNQELLAKVEAEVIDLFRHTDRSHPAVKELFNLCILRKAKSKLRKEA